MGRCVEAVGAAGTTALLGTGTVEFRGFVVSGVALRVDEFSSRPPDLNPAFTRVRLRGSLSVLGTGEFDPVSEPASLNLSATGAPGIVVAVLPPAVHVQFVVRDL